MITTQTPEFQATAEVVYPQSRIRELMRAGYMVICFDGFTPAEALDKFLKAVVDPTQWRADVCEVGGAATGNGTDRYYFVTTQPMRKPTDAADLEVLDELHEMLDSVDRDTLIHDLDQMRPQSTLGQTLLDVMQECDRRG